MTARAIRASSSEEVTMRLVELRRTLAGLSIVLAAAGTSAVCTPHTAWAADAASAGPALEPISIGSPTSIEVYPNKFELASPQREIHLVVTGHYADGTEQDLTRVSELASSNPAVLRLEERV